MPVIGPAGSGKTTLLRPWSSSTICGDVAWLTIERAHRDACVLTSDLTEEVRRVIAEPVAVHGELVAEAVDAIADAIDRSGRRVVNVLDDAHLLAQVESVGALAAS